MEQSFDGSPRAGSSVQAYAVAVLAVTISVVIRFALERWLAGNVPYLHFFPAILFAAWYGGFGPGVAATLLSTLAAMFLFLPPSGLAIGGSG